MTEAARINGRVLVVDDNELVADTTSMVLLSVGLNAVAVYDPYRALELAENGSFDLLLSDVIMPGMSGVELGIQIREGGYIPNVLLMSGMSTTSDLLEDARRRGYEFDILAKPTNTSELIAKLRELLDTKP
jgi:CheY-like chemotaxis protein